MKREYLDYCIKLVKKVLKENSCAIEVRETFPTNNKLAHFNILIRGVINDDIKEKTLSLLGGNWKCYKNPPNYTYFINNDEKADIRSYCLKLLIK